jgi:hypothetical protein
VDVFAKSTNRHRERKTTENLDAMVAHTQLSAFAEPRHLATLVPNQLDVDRVLWLEATKPTARQG